MVTEMILFNIAHRTWLNNNGVVLSPGFYFVSFVSGNKHRNHPKVPPQIMSNSEWIIKEEEDGELIWLKVRGDLAENPPDPKEYMWARLQAKPIYQ